MLAIKEKTVTPTKERINGFIDIEDCSIVVDVIQDIYDNRRNPDTLRRLYETNEMVYCLFSGACTEYVSDVDNWDDFKNRHAHDEDCQYLINLVNDMPTEISKELYEMAFDYWCQYDSEAMIRRVALIYDKLKCYALGLLLVDGGEYELF